MMTRWLEDVDSDVMLISTMILVLLRESLMAVWVN